MQMHSTGRETMTSGEARAAILSRHDQLRGVAEQSIRLASEAAAPDELLRGQARALCAAVRDHVEFEEGIMAIALADVVGLEGELLVQLDADHQRQRANAASTVAVLEPNTLPRARLVGSIRALAESVLLDLAGEERYFLTADVDELTDDSLGG